MQLLLYSMIESLNSHESSLNNYTFSKKLYIANNYLRIHINRKEKKKSIMEKIILYSRFLCFKIGYDDIWRKV